MKTSEIKLVHLRLYIKGEGAEIDSSMPKALVIYNEEDNKYHNIIIPEETYPLLKRLPYSNTTISGEEYGTKLIAVDPNQKDETCICAILTDDKFMSELKEQIYIEMKDLEDKILYSNLYFKDRIRIIEKRINNGVKVPKKLKRLISEDWERNCHYQDQVFFVKDERKKIIKK